MLMLRWSQLLPQHLHLHMHLQRGRQSQQEQEQKQAHGQPRMQTKTHHQRGGCGWHLQVRLLLLAAPPRRGQRWMAPMLPGWTRRRQRRGPRPRQPQLRLPQLR